LYDSIARAPMQYLGLQRPRTKPRDVFAEPPLQGLRMDEITQSDLLLLSLLLQFGSHNPRRLLDYNVPRASSSVAPISLRYGLI
jgi:hypothetical protein